MPTAPRAYRGSRVWWGGSARRARTRSPGRKSSATRHLLLGQDALLGQQHGDGAEPLLVIRRCQVLLRRHPLDRVPELVEVVDTAADQGTVEGEHVRLPVGVEGRLVGLLLHRREALHAPDVVDPAHGSSPRSAALPQTYPALPGPADTCGRRPGSEHPARPRARGPWAPRVP